MSLPSAVLRKIERFGSAESQAHLGQNLADADAADLLYRHAVAGLLISLLASSGLAFMATEQKHAKPALLWWMAMLFVLAVRAIDVYLVRRFKALPLRGRLQIIRFGSGLAGSALLWATYSFVFFGSLNETGKAYTAVILSAMVGGSATVLAPSRFLSIFYSACLLLPASTLFFFTRGADNIVLGVLGCLFFLVMAASSRITHRTIMNSIRLNRTNEALALEMMRERQRTEEANTELKAAQRELWNVNRSLECRIQERTADLAKEIREKEVYAKQLSLLASTDSLTGISNRFTMARKLADALSEARQTGASLAILFVDLDKFKEVNDVMGHYSGDRVLRTVAQRLSGHLASALALARWGGDEFVVALPGPVKAEQAVELAQDLRQRLLDPIQVDLGIVTIDATIGVALFPDHGSTHDELIRAADMAMYVGKETNVRAKLFDPSIGQHLAERHRMERALAEAVRSSALSLEFQPIIGAHSARCEMAEALVRWHHPQFGAMSPVQFIPMAERTGEITAIGRWVLLEACREAASWGEDAPAVAVNVSAVQINSGTLVSDVGRALNESGLTPCRLWLELTESVFAGDHSTINPILSSLREQGVRISLDDFGTGFSCLSYLRTLPIDMIKIDRSFVTSLSVDSGPIIKTIVTTAQAFRLRTVAEGVENEVQARALVEMGADYLQGFLFSKPMPPETIRQWLGTPRSRVAAANGS